MLVQALVARGVPLASTGGYPAELHASMLEYWDRGPRLPLSREEYLEAIRSSLQAQGYDPCACCSVQEGDDLMDLVADWPVGAVVERRLDELVVRELPEPAGYG